MKTKLLIFVLLLSQITDAQLVKRTSTNSGITFRDIVPVIEKKDFSGLDLSELDLTGGAFDHSICNNTNFTGAILHLSTFVASVLHNADFDGSDITNCTFTLTDFGYAYLGNVKATGVVFRDAGTISYVNFNHATLLGSNFYAVQAVSLIFDYADLTHATFYGLDASVGSTTFHGANLTIANFSYSLLNNSTFDNAVCIGTNFTGAKMPAYANTKTSFKLIVGAGHWDPVTTIWTDGNPIGP